MIKYGIKITDSSKIKNAIHAVNRAIATLKNWIESKNRAINIVTGIDATKKPWISQSTNANKAEIVQHIVAIG